MVNSTLIDVLLKIGTLIFNNVLMLSLPSKLSKSTRKLRRLVKKGFVTKLLHDTNSTEFLPYFRYKLLSKSGRLNF